MLVTNLCATLCDPMGYSLPVFSVHGILQQEYEWVAIPFSGEAKTNRDTKKAMAPHSSTLAWKIT